MNGDKMKILDVLTKQDVDLKASAVCDDDSLLHLAFTDKQLSQAQLIEILEIFLDRGVDINLIVRNSAGKTILHLAVERRMLDVIDLCLRRGADLSVSDSFGNTIAHFIVEEECRKFYRMTIRYNSEIEQYQMHERESASFVDWMAFKGIDFFHARNRQKLSALYLANELNLQHILVTLLKHVSDFRLVEKVQTPFLCAFLEVIGEPCRYFRHKSVQSIDSEHYQSRHVRSVVKTILEKNKYITDVTLNTALFSMIERGEEIDVIVMLLERVSDVNDRDIYDKFHGKSALEVFMNKFDKWQKVLNMYDCIALLRTFISKGARINERRYGGETIAHKIFCRFPKFAMLELLKENGADFRTLTNGKNFLHLISQYSNTPGMVDFLMNNNDWDLEVANYNGDTPLKIAVTFRSDVVARRLIELGAKINEIYSDGKTLMHLAVNDSKITELLIKNGADVNAKDKTGQTPLHQATNAIIVKLLFSAGAHVDAVDKKGNTPLYGSLTRENSTMITELLKYGANVRDPIVLELLHERFQRPGDYPGLRYSKQLFIKLIAVGSCDTTTYVPTGIMDGTLQQFFKQCQAEVEVLEGFFIDDCTSLYKLLNKSRGRRCSYADNEKLKALVEDPSIEQMFPNYFDLILGCYNDTVTRKPLLESAAFGLNELHETPLPDLCTDRITALLSNMDLKCFIEARGDRKLYGLNEAVSEMHL